MGNVARVFWRDVKRLAKTPAAWVVIIALCVLPSLYTWFNVAGFWNPYDNTGNLRVCVVNEDTGANDETLGKLNLGAQLVEKLEGDDRLGWAFMSREEAMDEINAGTAYAAFVIPESFSADMTTILTDDFQQPTLEYYVNEKTGPVSPKITDTGAGALDTAINDAFFSAVTSTVAATLDEKATDSKQILASARAKAADRLGKAATDIADARGALKSLTEAATGARAKSDTARASLSTAQRHIADLSAALDQTSTLAASANTALTSVSNSIGNALDTGAGQLSQAVTDTHLALAQTAAAIEASKGALGFDFQPKAPDVSEIVALLESVKALVSDEAVQQRIDGAIERIKSGAMPISPWIPADIAALKNSLDELAAAAGGSSSALADAAAQALRTAADYRATMAAQTIPALSAALANTASVSSNLAANVAAQDVLIDQARTVLDQLDLTLSSTAEALVQTDALLASLESDLRIVQTDLQALGSSTGLASLLGTDGINSESVAEFMMSPTQVQAVELYPLNAYGSAMAPLFINLTLWIGVFMLMVIIRLEVDEESIANLTINQRFFARGLLLSIIAAVQAAICCIGCVVMGVQTANAFLFILTAIIASMAYLSIQYTLSTTLQHVGKALCIILVFVQIPGATGLYPIEMTPQFFQNIYPLFPFTYGVNAMRETIGGFYDGTWGANVLTLIGFWAAFIAIGALLRPYVTNLNRLFAREIAESDMINGESVQLPARRYRMSQVIHAFADRDEYRAAIDARVMRFMGLYPKLKRIALGVAIAFPVLATALLATLSVDKVVMLNTWLVWFTLVVVFYMVLEYLRDNLSHLTSLEKMSAEDIRTIYAGRNRMFTRVQPLAHVQPLEGSANFLKPISEGRKETPSGEAPGERKDAPSDANEQQDAPSNEEVSDG